MNKYLIIGIIIVICALVAGCVSATPTEPNVRHTQVLWDEYFTSQSSSGAIAKIYIPEDNVTCYTFDNYNGGGISCLRNI